MKKQIKQRIADTLKVVAVILGIILLVDTIINSQSEMEDNDNEVYEAYKRDAYMNDLEGELRDAGYSDANISVDF